MTAPGSVPPPSPGWWVKRNRVMFPTSAAMALTGSTPTIFTPRGVFPSAGSMALSGTAPTITVVLPVAYNATGNAGVPAEFPTGTSGSWSHTATGTNRYVLVGLSVRTTSFTSATATYGGTAMTLLGTGLWNNTAAAGASLIFGMASPPTGAQTVAFTVSASSPLTAGQSFSFTGVNSVGSFVTNFGNGTAMSVSVTAPGSGMTFAMFGNNSGSTPSGFNQTVRMTAGSMTQHGYVGGTAQGTGSATSYTATGSTNWAGSGISLLA